MPLRSVAMGSLGEETVAQTRVSIKCSKCSSHAYEGNLRDLFGTEIVKSNWAVRGVRFSAFVCSKCGYIELFADNPKTVKRFLT